MTVRGVRRIVLAVCVVGIAGMIVSYIREASGAALAFGLIAAVAVTNLITATAVAGARPDATTEGAEVTR